MSVWKIKVRQRFWLSKQNDLQENGCLFGKLKFANDFGYYEELNLELAPIWLTIVKVIVIEGGKMLKILTK